MTNAFSKEAGLPTEVFTHLLFDNIPPILSDSFRNALQDFFQEQDKEQKTGIIRVEVTPGKYVTLILGEHNTVRDAEVPPMPLFLEDTGNDDMTIGANQYVGRNADPFLKKTIAAQFPIIYVDLNNNGGFDLESLIYRGEYAVIVLLSLPALISFLKDKKITRRDFCVLGVGVIVLIMKCLQEMKYRELLQMVISDDMSPENMDNLEQSLKRFQEVQFLTIWFRNVLFAYKIKYACEKQNIAESCFPVGAFHIGLRTLLQKPLTELEELIRTFYGRYKPIVDKYVTPETRVFLYMIATYTADENGMYAVSQENGIDIIQSLRDIFENSDTK